ncbi:hypothetical protein [Nocardia nova]|uniref:hypothetical protein n=1 Tax=Nocardia nova TaxID=37330 RepID=UPI0011DDFFBA|nr:hypothetical protein [Nocardia nova]
MDAELSGVDQALLTLDAERQAIPVAAERDLGNDVVRLAERQRRRTECRVGRDKQRRVHDGDLTRRDQAWADFAEYAGTHRFALRHLDDQATALREFRRDLDKVESALRLLSLRETAQKGAERELARAGGSPAFGD